METTLREARLEMLAHVEEGTNCPCCGRNQKVYTRRFNSGMARCLIWLVTNFDELEEDGFVDVQEAPPEILRIRQFDKLALFGCAYRKTQGKGDSGMWAPTWQGKLFVTGQMLMPEFKKVLNGNVQCVSENEVDIYAALTEKFNYEELIDGRGLVPQHTEPEDSSEPTLSVTAP